MPAAARVGFSTVCCEPNTNPINDSRQVTEDILAKTAEINLAAGGAMNEGVVSKKLGIAGISGAS